MMPKYAVDEEYQPTVTETVSEHTTITNDINASDAFTVIIGNDARVKNEHELVKNYLEERGARVVSIVAIARRLRESVYRYRTAPLT